MNADLLAFVREALSRGIAREAIADQLRGAGWRPEEISGAMASWADTSFPLPVPRRRPYLSAREAFLYLVLLLIIGGLALFVVGFLGEMVATMQEEVRALQRELEQLRRRPGPPTDR